MAFLLLKTLFGVAFYTIILILVIASIRISFWCFSDLRQDKWSGIGLGVLFICFTIILLVSAIAHLPFFE